MKSMLARLSRLRGRSIREIHERGRQELSKLSERVVRSATVEMTDSDLLNEIDRASRNGSGEGTAALIRERIQRFGVEVGDCAKSVTFFPSVARRRDIAALINRRFSRQRSSTVAAAQAARSGRFNLLGLRGLSFGEPVDWRLEPLSSKKTPLCHWSRIDYLDPSVAGDKKVTWELNRHQHFVTLGQAYCLDGDEEYARTFVRQATSWMDANPPNLGINWSSSLEIALRSISWLWALHLFAGSASVSPVFVTRLLKHLIAHGRHIESYLSLYFSPNTHLTGEALGLLYLGVALPELRRSAVWRETGSRILIEQLRRQVRSDGVYFEQASYYHRYTADFYIHLIVLARAAGLSLPREVEQTLELLLDHLMWITRPDGLSPLVGDDDGGRLVTLGARRRDDFRDTLATGAALLGRPDWKYVAGVAPIETLWLLGPDGLKRYDELRATPPADQCRVFAESGYCVMRDGWSRNSTYALINCGPHREVGGAHAHSDGLSLEFAALGTAWIVDPGTYTYTGDPTTRDQFRTTSAHNTVVVDGEPQSVPGKAFSWSYAAQATPLEFVSGPGFAYYEGSHDGYERLSDPVAHTRAFFLMKSAERIGQPAYMVIRDTLTARSLHEYEIRYHLSEKVRVSAKGNQIQAVSPTNDSLLIAAAGGPQPQAEIESGWVSRSYAAREPAPVAVFRAAGGGVAAFATLILPSSADERVLLKRTSFVEPRGFAFEFTVDDVLDQILVGADLRLRRGRSLAASGEVAWCRFKSGVPINAGLVLGSVLEVGQAFTFRSAQTTRYAAVSLEEGWLGLSVNGASLFKLMFKRPAREVVVNGTSFKIERGCRMAMFTGGARAWKMSPLA